MQLAFSMLSQFMYHDLDNLSHRSIDFGSDLFYRRAPRLHEKII